MKQDTGELSGEDGSNDPKSSDPKNESTPSSDSETESCRSSDWAAALTGPAGLTASIRVFADSLMRSEVTEMEMLKAREAAKWEAEKRRLEMEAELTRMTLQTQLQAASIAVRRNIPTRKRKRAQEHEPSTSARSMASLFLSLLFWNLSQA